MARALLRNKKSFNLPALVLIAIASGVIGYFIIHQSHASSLITASLGQSRSIEPATFGFNGENYSDNSAEWLTPGFVSAVTNLHLGLIRVGGGVGANYWDWKTGTFLGRASGGVTLGGPRPPLKLTDVAKVVKDSGATPLFDVNMVTATLNDQINMLYHAKALGLPIKYVELGNEVYINNEADAAAFADGVQYSAKANLWAKTIKADFPGVEVAACDLLAKYAEPSHLARMHDWPGQLAKHLNFKYIDAVTFHDYWNPPATLQNAASAASTMQTGMSEFTDRVLPSIRALPPGVRVWMTEWNFEDTTNWSHLANTWTEGLANAATAMTQLSANKVELSTPQSLLGSFLSTYFAITNNNLTAFGRAMSQLDGAIKGATSAQAMDFGSSPKQLLGWVFRPSAGIYNGPPPATKAIILNLDALPHSLKLPAPLNGANVTVTETTGSYNANASQLKTTNGRVVKGVLTLGPYSEAVLTVEPYQICSQPVGHFNASSCPVK